MSSLLSLNVAEHWGQHATCYLLQCNGIHNLDIKRQIGNNEFFASMLCWQFCDGGFVVAPEMHGNNLWDEHIKHIMIALWHAR